jgi:amino acid transporter
LCFTGKLEVIGIARLNAHFGRIINLFAVKWYGESEFWLSSGKLLLILMLFCFTFVTMVGGNPKHDAYGFRYWREPV